MSSSAKSASEELEAAPVANKGYAPKFLGPNIAAPTLTAAGKASAYSRDGSEAVHYTHFSLALNQKRRFASWVAWNIDGAALRKISRNGIPFILDPDIPAKYQAGDSLYAGNRLDRGHIARRADLCWGTDREARQANRDSFFFTNITPQMDEFNQGAMGGIWGKLEDAVFADVDVDNLRVSVFGGPVFRDDDRVFRGIKIPRSFYKVIAFVEGGRLKAKGFLLSQSLDDLEVLGLEPFRVYQVALEEIEKVTEVRFAKALKTADGFAATSAQESRAIPSREPLESLSAIQW